MTATLPKQREIPWLAGGALFLLYYVTARYGLRLDAVSQFATLLWPPTGLALVFLTLYGRSLFLPVFFAALLVNHEVGAPWPIATAIALGNTLEAVVGSYCLTRGNDFRCDLSRVRDIVRLIVGAALLSTMISATLGVAALLATHRMPEGQGAITWLSWWIGDALGNMVVAPFLFVWLGTSLPRPSPLALAKGILFVVVAMLTSAFAFGYIIHEPTASLALRYLAFPLIIWAAFRSGTRASVSALLILALFAIAAAFLFKSGNVLLAERSTRLLLTAFYLMVLAVTSLTLSTTVAERKASEEFAQDQREKLAAVFRTARSGIITTDEYGMIQDVNPAAEQLFGYTSAELLGSDVQTLMPEEFRPRHGLGLRSYLVSGQSKVIGRGRELVGLRKNGEQFPFFLTLSEMHVAKKRFFTGICHDITELKKSKDDLLERTQELERSNRDLEQFAFIASHDLQSPLRSIEGFLDLLSRRYQSQLDETAQRWIEHAVQGAIRMQSIIRGILEYARLQTPAQTQVETDVGIALQQVMLNLESEIRESGAVIIKNGPYPKIHFNPAQFLQVLQNLMGNALKFKREVPPTIRFHCEERPGEWLFRIEDNGIGIEQQYEDRIFGLFQRLHGKAEFPGNGLGLALCRKIVEGHEGKIWVESIPGTGSTFSFTVPKRLTNRRQREEAA